MLEQAPDAASNPVEGCWYSYAIVQVVPRVERDERLNVGVILFARTMDYLEARIELSPPRLLALAPGIDLALVAGHLRTFQAIAAGAPDAGAVALLGPSERFHWLTSPRSTVIQTSPVHVGYCTDPHRTMDKLMQELVRT